jgi:hypothetical protein
MPTADNIEHLDSVCSEFERLCRHVGRRILGQAEVGNAR